MIIKQLQNTHLLGMHIRKIRKVHEKKQFEIANALGVSTRYYRKIENEEVAVTLNHLKRLAEFYQIPVETIIHFDEKSFLLQAGIRAMDKSSTGDPDYVKTLKDTYEKLLNSKDDIIRRQNEYIQLLESRAHQG
ncbi:MAG: helix-turn-helix transcriptional regulator [Bacteroidia bacterium]|nr:helix-turn-helix transcriptional regulator [Bacteroidia bacterium]